MFKFELGQEIEIKLTGDFGTVDGRVEYIDSPSSYYVIYVNKQGSIIKEWLDEKHLSHLNK